MEAERRRWSYGRFLEEVLSRELALRAEKREGMLLRLARFPQIKTLEGFDLSNLPDLDPKVLAELGELGFLKRKENVLVRCKRRMELDDSVEKRTFYPVEKVTI